MCVGVLFKLHGCASFSLAPKGGLGGGGGGGGGVCIVIGHLKFV